MNSDGGFVLILTLSKMVEAVSIHTIDDVIKQVQKEQLPTVEEKQEKNNVLNVVDEETIIEEENSNDMEETIISEIENNSVEKDSSQQLFKKLIANIYNKSYELGECFEKSFTYSSYENNILKINSVAQGDCKTLLYKNFAHIKIFVAEVFGDATELEFEKIQKEATKETARIVQPSYNNSIGSMIEDIELHEDSPSSCVASMSAMKEPNLSQIELNMDDVLNSKMVNNAIQLFQPRNPPKIKSKL
jgi:DNA polymerase-3 subunit gamma/tau